MVSKQQVKTALIITLIIAAFTIVINALYFNVKIFAYAARGEYYPESTFHHVDIMFWKEATLSQKESAEAEFFQSLTELFEGESVTCLYAPSHNRNCFGLYDSSGFYNRYPLVKGQYWDFSAGLQSDTNFALISEGSDFHRRDPDAQEIHANKGSFLVTGIYDKYHPFSFSKDYLIPLRQAKIMDDYDGTVFIRSDNPEVIEGFFQLLGKYADLIIVDQTGIVDATTENIMKQDVNVSLKKTWNNIDKDSKLSWFSLILLLPLGLYIWLSHYALSIRQELKVRRLSGATRFNSWLLFSSRVILPGTVGIFIGLGVWELWVSGIETAPIRRYLRTTSGHFCRLSLAILLIILILTSLVFLFEDPDRLEKEGAK